MKHIIIITVVLVASSCSVLKRSTSQTSSARDKTESDSTLSVSAKLDTKITESIDTVITIPGSRLQGELTADSDMPFVMEDDNAKVTVHQGRVTSEVKSKKIPIRVSRVTEQKAQIKATGREIESTDRSSNEKQKDVSIKKIAAPWWIWLIIIIAALYFVLKRYKRYLL